MIKEREIVHPDVRPVYPMEPEHQDRVVSAVGSLLKLRAVPHEGAPFLNIGNPYPAGPNIMTPSHRSFSDTPITAAIGRHYNPGHQIWIGKEELAKTFQDILGINSDESETFPGITHRGAIRADQSLTRFMERGGAYLVPRGIDADREAIYQMINFCGIHLAEGRVPTIFPEGERVRAREDDPNPPDLSQIQKLKRGAGLVAVRWGAPIVPVAIVGASEMAFQKIGQERKTVVVNVGEPIHPDDFPEPKDHTIMRMSPAAQAMTDVLHHQLQGLFDEANEAHADLN